MMTCPSNIRPNQEVSPPTLNSTSAIICVAPSQVPSHLTTVSNTTLSYNLRHILAGSRMDQVSVRCCITAGVLAWLMTVDQCFGVEFCEAVATISIPFSQKQEPLSTQWSKAQHQLLHSKARDHLLVLVSFSYWEILRWYLGKGDPILQSRGTWGLSSFQAWHCHEFILEK